MDSILHTAVPLSEIFEVGLEQFHEYQCILHPQYPSVLISGSMSLTFFCVSNPLPNIEAQAQMEVAKETRFALVHSL